MIRVPIVISKVPCLRKILNGPIHVFLFLVLCSSPCVCVCVCVCVCGTRVRAYVRLCGLHHCCYDFTIQQKMFIVVVINCLCKFLTLNSNCDNVRYLPAQKRKKKHTPTIKKKLYRQIKMVKPIWYRTPDPIRKRKIHFVEVEYANHYTNEPNASY